MWILNAEKTVVQDLISDLFYNCIEHRKGRREWEIDDVKYRKKKSFDNKNSQIFSARFFILFTEFLVKSSAKSADNMGNIYFRAIDIENN